MGKCPNQVDNGKPMLWREGHVTGQVIGQVMGQVMGHVECHVIGKRGRWAESEK